MTTKEMKIGNIVHTESGSRCGGCAESLCGPDENWKDHSLARRGNAAERLNNGDFGRFYKVHDNEHVELAELFCPHCKALLSVELYLHGEPYRSDYLTLEAGRSEGYDPVAEFRDEPEAWTSF
jgi:acetone carboxylase gamma subunit